MSGNAVRASRCQRDRHVSRGRRHRCAFRAQRARRSLFLITCRVWHRCCSTTCTTSRMTITRRFVELDRCRISYLTAGDGAAAQPILLIHGSGMSAGSWVNQLLGLSATFRVTAIDLPGHGKSTAIPHASVETYAATVARFLEAIGARRVIVAGHSLGGSVAIALAARQPDAVTGLVLVASCAKLPRAETPGERWLAFLPGPLRRMLFFTMAQKLLFAPGAPSGALDIGMN